MATKQTPQEAKGSEVKPTKIIALILVILSLFPLPMAGYHTVNMLLHNVTADFLPVKSLVFLAWGGYLCLLGILVAHLGKD